MGYVSNYSRQIKAATGLSQYKKEVKEAVAYLKKNYQELLGVDEKIPAMVFDAVSKLLQEKSPSESSTKILRRVFEKYIARVPEGEASVKYYRQYNYNTDQQTPPAENQGLFELSPEEARAKNIFFINGIDSGTPYYENFYANIRNNYYKNSDYRGDIFNEVRNNTCCVMHTESVSLRFKLLFETQSEASDISYIPAHIFAKEILFPKAMDNDYKCVFFNHSMASAKYEGAETVLVQMLRKEGWKDEKIQETLGQGVAVHTSYPLIPRLTYQPQTPKICIISSADIIPPAKINIRPDYGDDLKMKTPFEICQDENNPNSFMIIVNHDLFGGIGNTFLGHSLDACLKVMSIYTEDTNPKSVQYTQGYHGIYNLLSEVLSNTHNGVNEKTMKEALTCGEDTILGIRKINP